MEITETYGARFELLLERLRAGDQLTRNRLVLRLVETELQCDVVTLMLPDATTEQRARDELKRGRAELEALIAEATALGGIAGTRPVRYVLVYNYGMGTVAIADECGDSFRWLAVHPPSRPAT